MNNKISLTKRTNKGRCLTGDGQLIFASLLAVPVVTGIIFSVKPMCALLIRLVK